MIDQILQQCTWTKFGMQAPNVPIAKLVHKFMREAVLDRHLYTSKIVGFYIDADNASSTVNGTSIARHPAIGDSYPEIMITLQDKLFFNSGSNNLKMILKPGDNTVHNNEFTNGVTSAPVLTVNPRICRVLNKEPITLNVKTLYSCGYKSMSDNSEAVDNKYFPCNTDFGINDYVRVLPMTPGTTAIPIRYYNGMTMDIFKSLIQAWNYCLKSKDVSEEERAWVYSYAQLMRKTY